MNIKIDYSIPLAGSEVFKVIKNLELLLRLNVQWHLRKHNLREKPLESGSIYKLAIYDERSEREVEITLKIVDFAENSHLSFELWEGNTFFRGFYFKVKDIETNRGLIEVEERRKTTISEQDRLELNLWIKSIINYAMLSRSKKTSSRIWKFFLDKCYLKLSPTGRRILFLVCISEIFALIFFIFLLLYYLFFPS